MKIINRFIALTVAMTMLAGSAHSQDCCAPQPCCEETCSYCDSCDASYMSAAIPLAILVVAGIAIAASDPSHHHHSSSSSGHFHAH